MVEPTLRTPRLTLVPLSDEHLDFEIELDADPEVMRYLGPTRSEDQVREWHRRRMAMGEQHPGLHFWVGHDDVEAVGWWMLEPPHRPDQGAPGGQAELGYRLLRRHWRKGYASEGSRELLRYGFQVLGLDRIFAETMAVNEGSRAVMRSIGMTYVRTFDPDVTYPVPGTEHGDVEYAITREQWRALQT